MGRTDDTAHGEGPGESASAPGPRTQQWLTGEFEGAYAGEESAMSAAATAGGAAPGRDYTIRFIRGRLKNPRRADAPPDPGGAVVVRVPGGWPLDVELPGGRLVEVRVGSSEVHGAELVLAKGGLPASHWSRALRGRQESGGIIRGTLYASSGGEVFGSADGQIPPDELARRPGCFGLGPWAWFLLLPLLILLLLLLLAMAAGVGLPWGGGAAAAAAAAGIPVLLILLLVLLIGLALLFAGLRGGSEAIGEAIGRWILPAAFGGMLLLWLLSFLKRCLLAAGGWPLMLLPIFAAIAARRPQALLGSVVMAALALYAQPRGENSDCLDTTVAATRERVEQRMSPDRNAEIVSLATRGSKSGERMTLDQALADPDAFFANCGQPIYVSSELLFDVNEATISERAPVQLRKLAALMSYRVGSRVRLEGYTDVTGTPAINAALSERRAQAVAAWLEANTSVQPTDIEVVGRGADAPIVSDPQRYQLNRRVEISVICSEGGGNR